METLDLAIKYIEEMYGGRLEGVVLFGSRARGDYAADSDYDLLILVNEYAEGPLQDYFGIYKALKLFRKRELKDTTVAVISLRDLEKSISTSLILNAYGRGGSSTTRREALKG